MLAHGTNGPLKYGQRASNRARSFVRGAASVRALRSVCVATKRGLRGGGRPSSAGATRSARRGGSAATNGNPARETRWRRAKVARRAARAAAGSVRRLLRGPAAVGAVRLTPTLLYRSVHENASAFRVSRTRPPTTHGDRASAPSPTIPAALLHVSTPKTAIVGP